MTAERTRAFLDASVLVAAARSPSGGSAVAIEVCAGHHFRAVLTLRVLAEARVNIAEKFGDTELVRFYRQLASMEPEIAPEPSDDGVAACVPLTTEKDAHVLAAALESDAAYLLTLDKRHLLNPLVLSAGLRVRVLTPGEFLQGIVTPPG